MAVCDADDVDYDADATRCYCVAAVHTRAFLQKTRITLSRLHGPMCAKRIVSGLHFLEWCLCECARNLCMKLTRIRKLSRAFSRIYKQKIVVADLQL